MMSYENLDVYKCSIEFLSVAMVLVDRMDRGDSVLRDQLRRAALSIPLNIAESSGKVSLGDRARFMAIARGSAMERSAAAGGACLDCLRVIHPATASQVSQGKDILERIVCMLSKMCRVGSERERHSVGSKDAHGRQENEGYSKDDPRYLRTHV
jgi:four helix bundle protein